ncbi:tyrosine-protein phosphatase [Rhodococcus sp. ACT016]|uniref:tyrosine-protein phosphatase n=1 Tax=Rhodococcus sp. ACT016 TaxID=3134808 RepID=UPI003D2664D3
MVQTPRLLSINNFRDLAGPDGGYITSDGRRVREGVLYRSNALTANDADAAVLDTLAVKAVYDLRTTAEIEKSPDRVPTGARYTHVNIIGDAASGSVTSSVDLSTPENAAAVLIDANRKFVTDPAMRAQFGTLLTDIATTDGPQVFHCTAGKDRAGWTSAVLLKIAGVDDATVMSNYLLTNEYSKDSIDATAAQITAAKGEQAGAAMKVLMGVSPEFLQAGFDEIAANFGTFDNYLTTGIGLSTDTIAALKTKLTA